MASAGSPAGQQRGIAEFRGTRQVPRPLNRQSAIPPDSALKSLPDPVTRPHSRTDAGTVILHWISAAAVITSLATGLRIASDAPVAPISQFLSPILPQGEIWTIHFIAGLVLFFSCAAYPLYLRRSGLQRRVAVKRLLVFTLPAAKRLRWGATNVALHWLAFILLTVLTVSGIVLYLGYGGWIVKVHTISAFGVIGYILGHVTSHFIFGGLDQILRVFRPSRLVWNRSVRPRPLL
ncbi:MAG TPA: cytochrome b/b6 domain-containing protein, partial [Afifellaceae bacterium]|nr:cytochrome b/b6 domain-containing protein [Afifellaceae bacterium]